MQDSDKVKMIIQKIYNKLNKEQKEDFVYGLICGLILGLVWGLVYGLVGGLVYGLVYGLVVIIINFKEAFPFLYNLYPILILIGLIILMSEVLFWMMPKEKIKDKILWHTTKRKAECIFETLLGFSGISQIYILIREIQVKQYLPEILKWIGYIGFVIFGLLIIFLIGYVWIRLNSLKYKR